jgi:hypothetical protein
MNSKKENTNLHNMAVVEMVEDGNQGSSDQGMHQGMPFLE